MDIDRYLTDAWRYFMNEGWVVQTFIVVFAALLTDWLQKRFIARLLVRVEKTRTVWDNALLEAVRRPLTALIWLLGITFAADIVRQENEVAIFGLIGPLREIGFITVLVWFLVRFVNRAEELYLRQRSQTGTPIDRTTAEAIAKLLRISVLITGFLVILQTLGYSISGVLAFGGVSGIVAGFAAKDVLANFFGGLMIYLDRPFEVGDWIRSPDQEIEGVVENIGWRLSRIRTFDKRPLYVPNSVFASITVENPSRMTNRRIYETIGIRYDDADRMALITRDVKQMLERHPEIDTDRTLMVNFVKFAPSSLDFFIYTFTKTTKWTEFHRIKQDVLLNIINIIRQHGAQCAFPTSTIHLANDGNGEPEPEADAPPMPHGRQKQE